LKVLDCNDRETTLRSLESILALDAEDISRRIRTVPRRDFHDYSILPSWAEPEPEEIVWFHLVRLHPTVEAAIRKDGLLPIRNSLPFYEEVFKAVAEAAELELDWEEVIERGNGAIWIRGQLGSGEQDKGPHGFLVKESLSTEHCPRYYHRAPQYVQEFCAELGTHGELLLDAFMAQSKISTIKFQAPTQGRNSRATAAALLYLHDCEHLGGPCETYKGFCGQGIPIGPERVLGIEDGPA